MQLRVQMLQPIKMDNERERNHLTVLDTNMTIDTLPWGKRV